MEKIVYGTILLFFAFLFFVIWIEHRQHKAWMQSRNNELQRIGKNWRKVDKPNNQESEVDRHGK